MTLSMLYIDREVAGLPETERIRSRLHIPAEVVDDARTVFDRVAGSDDPVRAGKKILFLTRNRGAFVRQCPGTRNYTCCDYKILHIGAYCVMDCTYCILQAYFHPPVLQYFVNHADMLSDLDRLFSETRISRIGTGEFTDSLIWERWTDLSRLLVRKFSDQDRAVLELKTKTTAIDRLETLDHGGKTVLAWSLNAEAVILSEERGTASLDARLAAATRCAARGFPLAFHFDPMIRYDGWKADYGRVLERLFSSIPPDRVVWISLGTFRFMPALKPIVESRFPDSRIIYGEFIPGLDGKMRYFKPLRIEMYRWMADRIRKLAPEVFVYLCMEDEEVWEKAMGYTPSDRGGLGRLLDERAVAHCRLDTRFLP